MHGHFLYLSNGNCLSQKEQFKLVGVVTAGAVGGGVGSVTFSALNDAPSFWGCWFVLFIGIGQLIKKRTRIKSDKDQKKEKKTKKQFARQYFCKWEYSGGDVAPKRRSKKYRSESIDQKVLNSIY